MWVNSAMKSTLPTSSWSYMGNTVRRILLTQVPIVRSVQQLQGCSLLFVRACLLGRPQYGPKSMAWAYAPQSLMRRRAFPSGGISFLRLRAPDLCSIQASVPYPFLWPRLHWRLPRRRLGREIVLPLVWRDSTMVGRTGMTSGLRMPTNILPSTPRTSSMCGRKVGICLLLLRRTYLMQLLCR